jgi:hypothetical protein
MTVPQELVSAIPQKISHKFQRAVDPAKDFRKFQIFTALFRFQKPTPSSGAENTGSGT